MAIFTGTALLFTLEEDQDQVFYQGTREISIDSDDGSFTVGNQDGAVFVDVTENFPIPVANTEFGRATFAVGDSVREGIYLELEGLFEAESLFDDIFGGEEDIAFTYRILAEGFELPPLEPGQPVDVLFEQDSIVIADLNDPANGGGAEYAPGTTVDYATIDGLANADGTLNQRQVQDVALLYEAAFDRQAEGEGLNYWIDQREDGFSLRGVAIEFISSEEFEELYGAPGEVSDEDYVALLYQNVLGRNPDAEGEAFWVNELASGAQDRAGLLIDFSDSPENVEQSTDLESLTEIEDGTWAFA